VYTREWVFARVGAQQERVCVRVRVSERVTRIEIQEHIATENETAIEPVNELTHEN
jgi:hypothetical protein